MTILLCAFIGFLFFYGLTAGELYRTEAVRALVAVEALRSGNWLLPTLYGEPFLTKPPGMYVAIALASAPFGGVSEWTARLPAACAAVLAVILLAGYFRRQLGNPAGGVIAVLLPMSFLWLDKATAAEIDMLQTAWVTASLVCFLRALEIAEGSPGAACRSKGSWFWWIAALMSVAGGVLTKWTAPAFFYGTVIPLLWWRGRLRLLICRQHLLAAILGASVCLAWTETAIRSGGWDVFYATVSRQALMHLSPAHHHRSYPWQETLVHPLRIWLASLPVSAFALPALWPGFARRWDERGRRLLQTLHCWIWPNLLFWSVVPEHAIRQAFPLLPGIAGLAAMVWLAWWTGRLEWPWPRVPPIKALVAALCCWLVVKLLFVHVVIPARNQGREPRVKGAQLAAHVPIRATLYVFRLKDEGIMFYFGRSARRLSGPEQLPCSAEPLYCILEEAEWRTWTRPAESVLSLNDEQGAPLRLVRTLP